MDHSLVAHSRGGVLCTPHPLASAAGLEVLDGGGTAIDAMLAASAVLAAVYPHMTGVGGDALWLLHDDQVRTIIGIGQAARACHNKAQSVCAAPLRSRRPREPWPVGYRPRPSVSTGARG